MNTLYNAGLASLSRRELLNVAWKLGAAAVVTPVISSRVWAEPRFNDYPFRLGVASGDPAADGVVLWTRLAPQPLAGGGLPNVAVDVDWEVAVNDSFRKVVRRGTTRAYPELGHSVHVEVAGLQPARDYWYRFWVAGNSSPIGRTRTAPAEGQLVDQLRIAVCGCSQFEQGYFTAYRHLAEQQFDAIFHTGDYIYEYRPYAGKSNRVRSHIGDETFTIGDYRNRYAQYKSDKDLQAAHASAPFIVTWDDHEVDNDWAAAANETNTPPEVFLLRRAAAFQAYYEAMPLRRSAFPTASHLQLYRELKFGELMSVDVLDTRQYRSSQIRQRITSASTLMDPSRTLLGKQQEAWLDTRLREDQSRWQVLAQQVPMFGRDARPGQHANSHVMDKWSGYPAAREKLMASLAAQPSRNRIVLSGDVHSHWAADLPRQMSEPEGPALAVEFTATSISSGGNGSDVASYWPDMKAEHPHVNYHSNRRGYLACTITPGHWQSDFMTLDQVREPNGVCTRDAQVVVEAGERGSQLL